MKEYGEFLKVFYFETKFFIGDNFSVFYGFSFSDRVDKAIMKLILDVKKYNRFI